MKLIVATDEKSGIGKNNKMPWKNSSDLKYFSKLTKGAGNNAVVMGKNTYLSIGKPLPGRENIVLSTSLNPDNEILVFSNIGLLLEYLEKSYIKNVWVIGGGQVYKEFMNVNLVTEIYKTCIKGIYDCDTFFEFDETLFEEDLSYRKTGQNGEIYKRLVLCANRNV